VPIPLHVARRLEDLNMPLVLFVPGGLTNHSHKLLFVWNRLNTRSL